MGESETQRFTQYVQARRFFGLYFRARPWQGEHLHRRIEKFRKGYWTIVEIGGIRKAPLCAGLF